MPPKFLNENRIAVIRFSNEEVEKNVENVINKIREYINGEFRLFKPPTP
ncbi:MAG: DUF559 domain-containing protein [Prevotella sp.]|nr:DUF559 domain-containing protein [Prevotella sp.]